MKIIKSTLEIGLLFKEGKRLSGRSVNLIINKESGQKDGRFVFIASKKIGNAVKRNKSKRLLREALFSLNCDCTGFDIAVIAKRNTTDFKSYEIASEIYCLLNDCEIFNETKETELF